MLFNASLDLFWMRVCLFVLLSKDGSPIKNVIKDPESSRSWKFLMNYNDWWCNIHYRRMVEQTSQSIHSWVRVCRTFVVVQSIYVSFNRATWGWIMIHLCISIIVIFCCNAQKYKLALRHLYILSLIQCWCFYHKC